MTTCAHRVRIGRLSGAGVTSCCELTDRGAGNLTLLLCETSTHSELLSCLSRPICPLWIRLWVIPSVEPTNTKPLTLGTLESQL